MGIGRPEVSKVQGFGCNGREESEVNDTKQLHVDVPVDLWKAIKRESFEIGCSMKELVVVVLNDVFTKKTPKTPVCGEMAGGVGERVMSGSARMNSEVTSKSERDRKMEESPLSTNSVPVNSSTLKEDHGWWYCDWCENRLPSSFKGVEGLNQIMFCSKECADEKQANL